MAAAPRADPHLLAGERLLSSRTTPRLSTPLLVFASAAALYLLCGRGRILSVDAQSMLAVTRSLSERGSLDVPPGTPSTAPGVGGRLYSIYGLGKPVANLPFYAVGAQLAARLPRLPEQRVIQFVVCLLNPLLTALCCALLLGLLTQLGVRPPPALGWTAAFGLGTIAFVYAKDDMSEPLAMLCVLAATRAAFAYRRALRISDAVACALWLDAATLTRPVLGALLGVLGPFLAWAMLRPPPQVSAGRRGLAAGAFLAVLAAGAGVLLLYNHARFGSVLESGYGRVGAGFRLDGSTLPHLLGMWISPGRGLLVYQPFLLLGAWGLALAWRERRAELLVCFAAVGSMALIHGLFSSWEGGWCWGPRFLLPELPLAIPLVAVGMEGAPRWRRALAAALVVLAVGLQLGAVVVPWQRYLHRVAAAGEQGQAVDVLWSLRDSQLAHQWPEALEVLRMGPEQRRGMSFDSSAWESRTEASVLEHSLGMNLPDFWWVSLAVLGLPKALLAAAVLVLLAVCVASAVELARRARMNGG